MMFNARFAYTDSMVGNLMRIEAARRVVDILPLPPAGILDLKRVARQKSSRGSVAIEGNPLDEAGALRAIAAADRSPDEHQQEIRNYWRALEWLEDRVAAGLVIDQGFIKALHGIIIVRTGGGRRGPSEYRSTECPVVDVVTRTIDYAPPRPRDVPALMADLAAWVESDRARALPGPVAAALLAHRFVSIHPFNDGNGRTARALATAALWRSGYYMQGFLSVEELYNSKRGEYYDSLQMGLPADFYSGRHDADHTRWIEYFVRVLYDASTQIGQQAERLYGAHAVDVPWSTLSRRQQQFLVRLSTRSLTHGAPAPSFTPSDVMDWFDVSRPTAYDWLDDWTNQRFIEPADVGLRIRRYRLTPSWAELLESVRLTAVARS
ncbi:MAG TPA: Fic family protein [Myxococcota bacterium]|nr:Fic family protein [Myxococcota bacterium]